MGLGVVPEVPLVVGRVFNYLDTNPGPYGFTPQGLGTIFSDLASQGVAITSNSWNGNATRPYDLDTQTLEKLVRSASQANFGPPMVMYHSAGNLDDAPTTFFITWPAFAKNLITIGANETFNPSAYDPNDPNYRPRTAYADASDGNDIWEWSRQGPTQPAAADGRTKPDLVAPGSGMESPMTRSTAFDTNSCTLVPNDPLFRVGPVGAVIDATPQQGHLWSRGTSFATPSAAGAGALLYTWFKNKNGNVAPKPSLLKAMQITLARRLTGAGAGLPPDVKQGWGKVDLTGLPDSLSPTDPYEWSNEDPTKIVTPAQRTAVLPAAGRGYRILNVSQPVRITVAWTDAPGDPAAGKKLVNDLDLKVVIHGNDGHFALGNNFNVATGRSSIFVSGVSMGVPDTRNNIEQVVFLASDVAGRNHFHVEVFGSVIQTDGIGVWNPGPSQQDFSVFIQNAEEYINNSLVTVDSVPATSVAAGATFQANFTLANTGTSVWTAAGSYKLVSIAGKAFGSELTLTPSDAIANPGSKAFTLNTTAPYAQGFYDLRWQMEEMGVRFGGATALRSIQVTGTPRSFYTVTPCRVFDTRDAGMGGALLHGIERVFMVRGACTIPANATAVAANLKVVGPTSPGYVTAYPANIGPPAVSTMNFNSGQTRANNAILTLDTQGRIALMPAGTTHLLFDVTGYFQ